MFKRNKETEKINLLETEISAAIKKAASGGKVRGENAGLGIMLGLFLGSVVVSGGIWLAMSGVNNGIVKDIEEVQAYLDSKEVKDQLEHRVKLINMKQTVQDYAVKMENCYDAFYSQPVIIGDKFDTLQLILDKTAEELDLDVDKCKISTPSYAGGMMTFTITAEGDEEFVQKLPSMYVDNIQEPSYTDNKGYFEKCSYTGYTVDTSVEEGQAEEEKVVNFAVSVAIKGRKSAYHPDDAA
jgi:type IV pilus assembly protein PilM